MNCGFCIGHGLFDQRTTVAKTDSEIIFELKLCAEIRILVSVKWELADDSDDKPS